MNRKRLIERPRSKEARNLSIPMDYKHIYSRSLTLKTASRSALAVGFNYLLEMNGYLEYFPYL